MPPPSDHAPDRRQFARAVAAAAVAPLAAGTASAQQPPAARAPAAPTEADLLMSLVEARYGKLLDDAQRKAIRRGLSRNVAISTLLRRAQLTNSDEPTFLFSADPS